MIDWYEYRHEMKPKQVFRTADGAVVKLDRRVPGDGTKWYVAGWSEYCDDWIYEDGTIEPGELAERLPDSYSPPAKATGGAA